MQTCPTLERLVLELHREKEHTIGLKQKLNLASVNLRNAKTKIERLEAEKLVLSHELFKLKDRIEYKGR